MPKVFMIKVESILKWTVEGSLLKKLKMVRAQILSKNSDAVALPDSDLHITLAAGSGWQKLRSRIKAKDIEEPEFSIEIDPTVKVIEEGWRKSWYVKLKNQQDWKEYVMDSLQGTYDSGRVYHITLANLTGNKMDSVALVEERDYKDEYKKFQSSKKSKKIILSGIYFLRGISIILFIFTPASNISAFLFGASFGFLWLSTVPATSGIVAHLFGTKYLGMLYGIVFLSHQIGSFFGAYLGGLFHDLYGSYDYAWYLAIALSVFAAIIHLPIKEEPVLRLKTE